MRHPVRLGRQRKMKYGLKRHKGMREKGTDKWRSTCAKLVALEFVLSAIFLSLGHVLENYYFKGVGIGLLISWVTGALAYFVVRKKT